jgi:MYXO-CTERM domain-containing protein
MYSSDKTLLASAVAAILVAVAAPAGATPNFPPAIAATLGLPAAPECSLCHDGPTQLGTVTTPFGKSMRAHGLMPYDEASLKKALAELESEGTDSDGDGIGDIDELRHGTDPNVPEGGQAEITAEYGCAVHPGREPGSLGATLVLIAVVLLTRRIRRGKESAR